MASQLPGCHGGQFGGRPQLICLCNESDLRLPRPASNRPQIQSSRHPGQSTWPDLPITYAEPGTVGLGGGEIGACAVVKTEIVRARLFSNKRTYDFGGYPDTCAYPHGLVCAPELSYPGMHAAPHRFRLSILTSRLGRLAVRGLEGGAVLVGFSSGSGVERPVVAGSGSPRAAAAIGSSTGAIGSAAVVARDGLPYLTTAPGGGSYAAKPELGAREGCSRAYRPKAKHAPTAQ